jgi:hypothetical protein
LVQFKTSFGIHSLKKVLVPIVCKRFGRVSEKFWCSFKKSFGTVLKRFGTVFKRFGTVFKFLYGFKKV